MTNISFNLSGKLDPPFLEVLRIVNQVAAALGIRFFVVGAMARDIVLEYCHGIPAVADRHGVRAHIRSTGGGRPNKPISWQTPSMRFKGWREGTGHL
jgi:hypothetical protein